MKFEDFKCKKLLGVHRLGARLQDSTVAIINRRFKDDVLTQRGTFVCQQLAANYNGLRLIVIPSYMFDIEATEICASALFKNVKTLYLQFYLPSFEYV
ncbi:MAG: hypothetical protein ACXVAO_07940 [Vulcanimicrobiaceae bacterium]